MRQDVGCAKAPALTLPSALQCCAPCAPSRAHGAHGARHRCTASTAARAPLRTLRTPVDVAADRRYQIVPGKRVEGQMSDPIIRVTDIAWVRLRAPDLDLQERF